MADDETLKDDEIEGWMDVPREVRAVVYDTLDEQIVKYQKRESMAKLTAKLVGPIDPDHSGAAKMLESQLIAKALVIGLATLQSHDPEFCPHCGDFHDESFDHTKNMSPKDLS